MEMSWCTPAEDIAKEEIELVWPLIEEDMSALSEFFDGQGWDLRRADPIVMMAAACAIERFALVAEDQLGAPAGIKAKLDSQVRWIRDVAWGLKVSERRSKAVG